MLPNLPQEIIDLVVDGLTTGQELCEDERLYSLQSCALVSRSFTIRARFHLFSKLSLRWTSKSGMARLTLRRTQYLRQLLEADPIFLQSIQTLDIGIPVPMHSNMLKQITGTHSGLSEIITFLYSTPCSRLHTLLLTGFTETAFDSEAGLQDRTHFWHDIGFLPALYSLCLSGALHTLKLGYLRDVPAEFFSKLHQNIKCITLSEVTLAEAVYLYSIPLPPTGFIDRPILEEIHAKDEDLYRITHGSSSGADIPSFGPQLARLQTLDCIVSTAPCEELPYWTVIQEASASLTTLRLAVDSSFHMQGAYEFMLIDLGTLPALRTLIFQIKDSPPHYWTGLDAVIHMLANASGHTALEVVRIDILTDVGLIPEPYSITEEHGKRMALDSLDGALTCGVHPSLHMFQLRLFSPALEIDIAIDHPDRIPRYVSNHRQPLIEKLPRAHALGLLKDKEGEVPQADIVISVDDPTW